MVCHEARSLIFIFIFYQLCQVGSSGFIQNPSNVTICIGSSALFTCTINEMRTVFWLINGSDSYSVIGSQPVTILLPYGSGVMSTLSVPAIRPWNAISIACTYSSFVSARAYLTAQACASITVVKEPADVIESYQGGTVTMSVTASGANLRYLWVRADNKRSLTNDVRIVGANTPNITIQNLNKSDQGSYRCVVSNSEGTTTMSEKAYLIVQKAQSRFLNITMIAYYACFEMRFEVKQILPRAKCNPADFLDYISDSYTHGQVYSVCLSYPFRGINIVVLNEETGRVMAATRFDTFQPNYDEPMVTYLKNVPDGRILCLFVQDEGSSNLRSNARQYLKFLGSNAIETLSYRDMWAFVTVKGNKPYGEVTSPLRSSPIVLTVAVPLQ